MKNKIDYNYLSRVLIPIKKAIKNQGKLLIIFVGIPGSGKTTISQYLCKYNGFVKVSTDDIKKFLINNNYEFTLKDVFKIQRKIFKNLLKNNIKIISDSNSDLSKYRSYLKRLIKDFRYKAIIFYLDVNIKKAYERILLKKGYKNSKKIYKNIKKFKDNIQIPKKAIRINCNLSKQKVFNQVKAFFIFK